ncbi:MAG: hypothetical protein ACLRO4_00245 [Lachnospiraceae bacterium]
MNILLERWKENALILLMAKTAAIIIVCFEDRVNVCIGIDIETNPSSNFAISTMESYAEHPILNLYTLGLETDQEVAQMFVSVNTDDCGIFHTSLENVYALLALSVENFTNENGRQTL